MTPDRLQFLCLRLGERFFAVDIMCIREILRATRPTPVPDAPAVVAGVLNVRGELLTVLDLAKALSVETGHGPEKDRRILLVRHSGENFGLLVDAVEDVAPLEVEALEPAPVAQGSGTAVLAMFRRALSGGAEQVVLLIHLAVLARLAKGEVADGPS